MAGTQAAFTVTGNVPHLRLTGGQGTTLTGAGANETRIGAKQTAIQHSNGTNRQVAGAHAASTTPAINPSTRTNSLQASRRLARGIQKGTLNRSNVSGSGTPEGKPKSVAGMPHTFNVGGDGGRSSVLVTVPTGASTTKAHTKAIVTLRQNGGNIPKNDPAKNPLSAPSLKPVHIGFNHVGYR